MSVITISRQFGAGGRSLGKMIADELGYRFLDDLIIQELAEKANVTTDSIKSMERTAGSMVSKIISGMLNRSYMERIIGAGKGYINEEVYVELLRNVITTFAEEDNVVLLGRGGQYILKDHKGTFHILLISDMKHRIEFMQRYYDMSDERAKKAIQQGQIRRHNLYKKLHRRNYNDPDFYHLVLNMSKLSLEKALAIVITLVLKNKEGQS
jgi:cytidylate kinase